MDVLLSEPTRYLKPERGKQGLASPTTQAPWLLGNTLRAVETSWL